MSWLAMDILSSRENAVLKFAYQHILIRDVIKFIRLMSLRKFFLLQQKRVEYAHL